MELSELFAKLPFLREILTAFVVVFVDFCALFILIAAARERRYGDKSWIRETRGLMLLCGEDCYPLGAAEILIGRHPAADIRFPDLNISRFHALLTFSGGQWQIEDLGAQHGVTVNGKRISEPCRLRVHDVIGIGSRSLIVIKGERSQS